MSTKVTLLLILFYVFVQTHCQTAKKDETIKDLLEEKIRIGQHSGLNYIFLFAAATIVVFIRYATASYEIPVSYAVFAVMIGILWGIGCLYSKGMRLMTSKPNDVVRNINIVYLPAVVYSTAFGTDTYAFVKSLSQILSIGTCVGMTSAVTTGLLMRLVLSKGWTHADAILFGLILIPIFPVSLLNWMKGSNAHLKHIKVLLEGEILLGCAVATVAVILIMGYIDEWMIYWYQFVFWLLRDFAVGLPLSYLYGLLGVSLMKLASNDSPGLMILTVAMCYSTYFLLKWTTNGGIIGTAIVGLVMGLERASLSQDMEKTIIDFWTMVTLIISDILFVYIGVLTPLLLNDLEFYDYILVFVTYLITNITRLLSFFLFSPILSRMGYGMSFRDMIICVWGGLKNPICLNMALDLYDGVYKKQHDKAKIFFLHTVAVYMLMLFVNDTCVHILMKALGLSEISISRQVTMNNCMKYIYESRIRTVAILKMDRFLSDANWPLVISATSLKHPYQKYINLEVAKNEALEEKGDEYILGNRYSYCSDCHKNVLNEPTPKEFKEMTKETKMRLLKLKKTAYSRQYENGMISKEGIRIMHQAVEIAMDTEELVIELNDLLRLFNKEGIFYRFLRILWQYFFLNKSESYKPPRKQGRLICYRIVAHVAFRIFINLIVVLNIILLAVHYFYETNNYDKDLAFYLHSSFCLFYFFEFWLKIFALSWIYIWRHGFYFYFRNIWYILEFIVMVLSFVAAVSHAIYNEIDNEIPESFYLIDLVLYFGLSIRTLGIFIGTLKLWPCCQSLTDSMMKFLDAKVDRHRALAYELGKSYIAGEEEILENLHQIVDNAKIREPIRIKIEEDRLAVMKRLGLAQKESPGIAITVKTKLAMRTVLSSMKSDVQELKVSGWVDDVEYNKLLKSLNDRYKYINNIKVIEPSSPKLIFREISYMGDNDELIEFLYNNIVTKKFDPGEVVVNEGETIDGIHILISGMFFITFTPRDEVSEKLREIGALPVVDYVVSLAFEEKLSEYIVPGNTVGELCMLTGRSYNGTIVAETHSQVYILNRNIIEKAFAKDNDPVTGLECRMWKYIGFRKALTVMMNVPSYHSYTKERIKFILERAFMPNLSNYKVFVVNEMIEDIILVEGIAVDFNTRDIYTGPCYMPRAVQKLVLPKSSFVDIDVAIETKLLIIPSKDYNEYEIMVAEEDICELVAEDSSRCLRHIIQEKAAVSAKASKASKQMAGILSGLRKRMLGLDSSLKSANKSRQTV